MPLSAETGRVLSVHDELRSRHILGARLATDPIAGRRAATTRRSRHGTAVRVPDPRRLGSRAKRKAGAAAVGYG
jgi:hypothetical protein